MSVSQILFIIFSGLFLISTILQLIGRAKKIKLMECICKPLVYAFLLATSITALIQQLPDSFMIIICLSISAAANLGNAILSFFTKTKKNIIISGILFELSFIPWIYLLFPSFALFSLSTLTTALIIAAYIVLLTIFYIFVIGIRSPAKTAGIFIFFIPMIFLHYSSILTMIGQPKLYSYILFAGTTVLIISQGLYLRGFFKKTLDFDRFLRTLLLIISLLLINAGFVIMVSL